MKASVCLHKRKRRLAAEEAAPEVPPEGAVPDVALVKAWRYHPRLQRHLRRFLRSDVSTVLRRYEARAAAMDTATLMRSMCHVGSWVALLPLCDVATCAENDCLSPVALLARLLQLLFTRCPQEGTNKRSRRLSPWLLGILMLVEQRAGEILNMGSLAGVETERVRASSTLKNDDQARCNWMQLWSFLPRSSRGRSLPLQRQHSTSHVCGGSKTTSKISCDTSTVCTQGGLPASMVSVGAADEISSEVSQGREIVPYSKIAQSSLVGTTLRSGTKAHRALVLLNREIERWASRTSSERKCHLCRLDAMLSQAEAAQDWGTLLLVLRQAAAALSAPRRRDESLPVGNPAVTDVPLMGKQETFVQQRHLRRIFLRTLEVLQGFESDERVDCVVEHVWSLLNRFGETDGKAESREAMLRLLSSGEQWICVLRAVAAHRASSYSTVRSFGRDSAFAACDDQVCVSRQSHVDDSTRSTVRAAHASVTEVYTPGEKIIALHTVVHRPLETKILRCDNCGFLVKSSWFFVHPNTKKSAVLVPYNGHSKCRRLLKQRIYLTVVDGYPRKFDTMVNVEYCHHGRNRAQCAPCGGCAMCKHGRRRDACKQCCCTVKRRRQTSG